MLEFFEAVIRIFGSFLEGAFWFGIAMIILFLGLFVACLFGASLVVTFFS